MGERAPRGPSTFRQRDVTAAMRAVEKDGKEIYCVEVDRNGTIRILTRPLEKVAEAEGRGWEDV